MDENYLFEYGSQTNKETLEEKIGKHKHTMELIRTLIGFIVLGIQIFILYHLTHQK